MSNIFINVWLACLRVIFRFFHIVYTSFQYFDLTWSLFKKKWETTFAMNEMDSELYVSRFVTSLNTCPSHLAVIVANDAIVCENFTNLVVWCLAAGISFLTVYDQKGIIKDQERKLHKLLLANSNIKENQVIFRNIPRTNGIGGNGFKSKLFVSLLSGSDGKESFMKTVSALSKSLCADKLKLDEAMISGELYNQLRFPDPELAIVVAPEMCTHGYPPWNIRLTEFVRIPSLELTAKEFCGVLERYSRCQKRLGK